MLSIMKFQELEHGTGDFQDTRARIADVSRMSSSRKIVVGSSSCCWDVSS